MVLREEVKRECRARVSRRANRRLPPQLSLGSPFHNCHWSLLWEGMEGTTIQEPGDLPSTSPVCRPGRAERADLRRGDTGWRGGRAGATGEPGSHSETSPPPVFGRGSCPFRRRRSMAFRQRLTLAAALLCTTILPARADDTLETV